MLHVTAQGNCGEKYHFFQIHCCRQQSVLNKSLRWEAAC
jgi:hypothetical protein